MKNKKEEKNEKEERLREEASQSKGIGNPGGSQSGGTDRKETAEELKKKASREKKRDSKD